MAEIKTPEQLAKEHIAAYDGLAAGDEGLIKAAAAAIEADRAQRQPEIYIVQNDVGDVVDVFRDADEAREAYPEDHVYTLTEDTIWEPGEWRTGAATTPTDSKED